ncbi:MULTISPECIES: hypothetical protein [Actinomadura]|uniref:Uncharacterized protein n=1 Tax=Actinomadura yumaensis TaxID=111807 RepID=A0ABW2D2L1_9ACTN|nr:hypothetical protein [Actinomadura sp. J1-007]
MFFAAGTLTLADHGPLSAVPAAFLSGAAAAGAAVVGGARS